MVVWEPSPYGYRHDTTLGGAASRLRFALGTAGGHDVLHAFGGRSWVPYLDVLAARARGRTCVVQYNGTEVRCSRIARRLHPARARAVDPAGDRSTRIHRRAAGRVAHAALVQDLELASYLLDDYRAVYVVPFAIDLPALDEVEAGTAPSVPGAPRRVLHAPSSRRVKGSDLIEAAMCAAAEEVPFEPVTLSGAPHSAVLAELARADLVVDQLNCEAPGVLAAEAMALGKPVLCEYDAAKLASFARPTPVVQITPQTVAERLVELLRNTDSRMDLARRGREYARRTHAPIAAARAAGAAYKHARVASDGLFEIAPDGSVRELDRATLAPRQSRY
jgi:hypothetical protein